MAKTTSTTGKATAPASPPAPRKAAATKPAAKTSAKTAGKVAPASGRRATPAKATNAAKAIKPVKVEKAEKPAKTVKPVSAAPKAAAEKAKKPKLVRDSFTMPDNEYALIAQVKKACVGAGFEIKKSELLRIGIALLAKMDPKALQQAQQALAPLKAGRPKKK